MAIKMVVGPEHAGEPNVEEITYPGIEGPLYLRTSHVGLVLADRERNGYHDSDFYAVVWNAEKGCTEEITYATTRGWTYCNSCKVDATPEVLAAVGVWHSILKAQAAQARAEEEAGTPRIGKRVRATRGTKRCPKGTEGVVFWYGEGRYFGPVPRFRGGWTCRGPMRVGFKTDAGQEFWTNACSVEVLQEQEATA